MYFIQFICGGILFVSLYYFSQNKESSVSALIPAIPSLGLIGLYYISSKGNNHILNYIKCIIIFFSLYVIIFSIMYGLYSVTKNLKLSCIISIISWIFLIYIIFSKNFV